MARAARTPGGSNRARSCARGGDEPADFDRVLHQLIAARLLTADGDDDHGREACVDLAHEVLIASWPTLAGWIQTHRGEEQRRRQLEAAAAEWVKHGRGPRGLLDVIELAEAEAWRRTESARELGPSTDVAALVAPSRAAQDRQRRLRRALVAALALFAAVVAVLAVMARHQTSETQRLLAQSYQEAGRQLAEGAGDNLDAERGRGARCSAVLAHWLPRSPGSPIAAHRRRSGPEPGCGGEWIRRSQLTAAR